MRNSRLKSVHSLDLAIVVALLVALLVVPVAFLVPFSDEWMRVNYMHVTSSNSQSFHQAVLQRAELKAQALAYMTTLFVRHRCP
jgi:hypothetical protein